MRSPTEFNSTPKAGEVLQEYYLRLVGRYRECIAPEPPPAYGASAGAAAQQPQQPQRGPSDVGAVASPRPPADECIR